MSRHHILPPLAYLPPQPKKIEKPKRRIHVGTADETEEATQTREASAPDQFLSPGGVLPKPDFPAIEGSEEKPHHPQGRLSEDTLRAMLQVQESRAG
jgi:hypothetical protein